MSSAALRLAPLNNRSSTRISLRHRLRSTGVTASSPLDYSQRTGYPADMDGIAAASVHTVLADADGTAYRSLRHRPVTRAERYALGKSLRKRVGRMVDSPYGFLRGTAVVMAEDVAHLPATGITPVVCGDSHFGNFGFYASPERDLVIDLNDFDEAHPGCWEWDLRRLAASIWVAGRHNGTSEDHCGNAVLSCVASYRHELRRLADLPGEIVAQE